MRSKYYSPIEVAAHSTLKDLWVSYLGKVYDLTPLADTHQGDVLLKPIVLCAGTDISHWFNKKTREIKTYVDPVTNCEQYYTPNGRFIHVPPPYPTDDWANDFGRPWWKDDKYCVGVLSQKTRRIKVINTLTSQEVIIEVCSEETMLEILRRYLKENCHAGSYTWKYAGRNLEMDKTLEENCVKDDDEDFYICRMDQDHFVQAIHLYFNDDLTES